MVGQETGSEAMIESGWTIRMRLRWLEVMTVVVVVVVRTLSSFFCSRC